MRFLSAFAWRNPVLMRELKVRVSSWQALAGLVSYLLVLVGIVIAITHARSSATVRGTGQVGISQLGDIGQSMFEYILFFAVVLILFVVPGYVAPSIAGERERGTLLHLQISPMRPRSIVLGKLIAAALYICLLVAMTMPLVIVTYLTGGITGRDIAVGLLTVALTGGAISCITIGCSALVRRAQVAVVLAYCVVLLLVAGTLLAFSLASEFERSEGDQSSEPSTWLLAANPLAPVADVIGERNQDGPDSFDQFGLPQLQRGSPLRTVRELMHLDSADFGNFGPFGPFGPGVVFDQFGRPIDGNGEEDDGADALALWARSGIVLGALSVLSIAVAVRGVSRSRLSP